MRSIQTDLLAVTFGLDVMARQVASSMIFKPLSQIIEIPDTSLNEKLVPANDNHEPTAMSRENLEAASILAPRGEVSRPAKFLCSLPPCFVWLSRRWYLGPGFDSAAKSSRAKTARTRPRCDPSSVRFILWFDLVWRCGRFRRGCHLPMR